MIFNKLTAALLLAGSFAFVACDRIEEGNRLKPMNDPEPENPTQSQHTVLLEDYTGQECSNCPVFASKLHKALEGDLKSHAGRVVTVAIHSHLLPHKGSDFPTADGEAYARWLGLDAVPKAVIDRTGENGLVSATGDITETIERLKKALAQPAQMDLFAKASFNADRTAVSVSVVAVGAKKEDAKQYNVQLWLLENDIKAFQEYPGGKHKEDHEHDHVLRAALNGTWGEPIQLGGKYLHTSNLPQTVLETAKQNPDNLRVVAFVYDAQTKSVIETIEVGIK